MTSPTAHTTTPTVFSEPARGAFAVGVPLVGGRLLGFFGGIILARWLGAATFGAYGWLLAWAAVLTTMSAFGFDMLLVRDVAAYHAHGDLGALAGLRRVATLTTTAIALPLAALAVLALPTLARGDALVTTFACAILALLVVAGALTRVRQSVLRGLHRPVVAQLAEAVVHPAALLALLLLALRAAAPSLSLALALNAIAALGALLSVSWLLHRTERARTTAPATYDTRLWLASASRMLLLTSLIALHGRLDILALGALAGVSTVGPYAAAVSGASLVPTALNITVIALAPTLAALAATGQIEALRTAAMRTVRLSLLGGLPVALAMIFFGQHFLSLYGARFGGARTALTVLTVGQIVNIVAGPVATLLAMAGHERDALVGMGVATAGHAMLCLLLIPRWGITGAAVASALSVCGWNIILWVYVRRRLGITLTPFGS